MLKVTHETQDTFSERIADGAGVSLEIVQDTLRRPGAGDGPCWLWRKAKYGTTPIMHHDGKPQPVRRVVLTSIHGELPSTFRAVSACSDKNCVSPNHIMVKDRYVEGQITLGLPKEIENVEDDVMDVVDAVYSCDQPWNAADLAEDFDYPLTLVEEAIRKIVKEGL